ncbi:hypothetical protein ScPMuIL_018736 [Solemya velum]
MDLKIIGVTLWTIFHLLTGVFAARKGNGLLSAGCHAWCLWKHRDYLFHRFGGDPQKEERPIMEDCLQSLKCLACLKPCGTPPEKISTCSQQCLDDEKQCLQACLYLQDEHHNKTGSCPDPQKAIAFEAVCVDVCEDDAACEENRKCCSNGCGHTCQRPIQIADNLPAIPSNITLKEKRRGLAVKVTWQRESLSRNQQPVVYVIEMRKTNSQKALWGKDTPWKLVVQTEPRHTTIHRIWAGHWYQFRIAAVNSEGSRGFSDPSPIFKSSRAVGKPSRPRNLTEGETTLRENKVDVTLTWQAPKRCDLPVWRYTVYFSMRLAEVSPVWVLIDVLQKVVPGDQTHCILKGLEPGMTYYVQVEAMIRHGRTRLKGDKASMYITTYAPPGYIRDSPLSDSRVPYHPEMIEVLNLEVGDVFFHNKSLKAHLQWRVDKFVESSVQRFMLYWSLVTLRCDQQYNSSSLTAKMATSHKQEFLLYDLLFECDYLVKVSAVSTQDVQGQPSSVNFYTPLCSQIIKINGKLPPNCPNQIPRVPQQPPSLNYTVEKEQCNVTVKVRWKPPYSDLPIEGYVVIWGEAESTKDVTYKRESVNYKARPAERNVLTNTVQYSLPNLVASSYYVIKIKAWSRAGRGKSAVRGVFTPVLESCHSQTIMSTGSSQIVEQKSKPMNSIQVEAVQSTPTSPARSGATSTISAYSIISLLTLLLMCHSSFLHL